MAEVPNRIGVEFYFDNNMDPIPRERAAVVWWVSEDNKIIDLKVYNRGDEEVEEDNLDLARRVSGIILEDGHMQFTLGNIELNTYNWSVKELVTLVMGRHNLSGNVFCKILDQLARIQELAPMFRRFDMVEREPENQ